jgi:chaperonin GroEL
VVDHATTTVVAGGGDAAAVRARRRGLEREIEAVASRYHREKLVARRARLGGQVAVIRVGAPTEVALRQRLSQFEDALAATRAALKEGIVVGGGVALLRAAAAVESLSLSGDEALGASVVGRAMCEPLRWIALNAGATGDVVVEEVQQLAGAMGFNAWTRGYENLVDAGIVDPTLVVRVALQNAASIAGLMLTTDAVVAARPESGEDEEGEAEAS